MRRLAIFLAFCAGLGACSGPADEAKAIVREELVDGQSARFENVVVDKGSNRVCGWVNSKNRMGAYAGAETFLVENGRVTTLGNRREEGADSSFGACVANDRAASDRLMRDVNRSLDNYEAALKAQ